MKVIIEDGEKKTVFQDVLDCYIAVRQLHTLMNGTNEVAKSIETRSYSWGSNIRELVKEVRQSLIELDEMSREVKSANTKPV